MVGKHTCRMFQHLQTLGRIQTAEELLAWTGTRLRAVVPHDAFACGMARIGPNSMKPILVLTSNTPADFASFVENAESLHDLARNLDREGILIAAAESASEVEPPGSWRAYLHRNRLANMACHGIVEYSRNYASWFTLFRVPDELPEHPCRLLQLYTPHVHLALTRILHEPALQQATLRNRAALSTRELEVLAWICRGKTGPEIAAIHGVAINTVKNQIQSILVKLRVNTQAQAAAKAVHEGLVML